jgi:hypothetical protein
LPPLRTQPSTNQLTYAFSYIILTSVDR